MPPGAMKLALWSDWYDFSVHHGPHDAHLMEARLFQAASGEFLEDAVLSLNIELLGAYHDGKINLRYPHVFRYEIGSQDCTLPMNDWRYDEFKLSDNGRLLHEIEWGNGDRWLIEADDIEYKWLPFEKANGSK